MKLPTNDFQERALAAEKNFSILCDEFNKNKIKMSEIENMLQKYKLFYVTRTALLACEQRREHYRAALINIVQSDLSVDELREIAKHALE